MVPIYDTTVNGGKPISMERFRLAGLNDDQVNGIYDAIHKHSKSEKG